MIRATGRSMITAAVLLIFACLFAPSPRARGISGNGDYKRSEVKFFTVDHSVFRYDERHLQLEAYALIDREYLETETHDGGVRARYEITFQILEDDSLLIGDSWVRSDWSRADSLRVAGQKIPELVRYMIRPGEYRVAVRIVDLIGGSYFIENYPITVEQIGYDGIAISDILLASRIEKAEGNVAEFDHNGLLVLPNAERMFGSNNPQVYYYAEIYNLTESDTAHYLVDRAILDDRGAVIRRFERREHPVPAADVVEVDAFSAATLRTGAYTLRIAVTDAASGDTDAADRRFWVFRQGEDVQYAQRIDPGFDVDAIPDSSIDLELHAIRYLLSNRIRKATGELKTPSAKRAFLSRFWAANDPDTSTAINEFRDEYLRRLKLANDRYGTLQREGWKTDRGRVLLMHGEPNYIDDHPFDPTTNGAWQVWEYDQVEGGVIFVFVDRNNLGEYVQVHSTKKGEVNNPDWRRIEFSR